MWCAVPIFELGRAIPVISHVWKFGFDWLSLSRVIVSTNIFLGVINPLSRGGCFWHVMPIFELGWAIPVKIHVLKFGLDWLKSEVCEFSGGQKPPIRGVTCDFRCPSLNLAELFHSKSHVWKFCSDWSSLSRVIVSTNKHTSLQKKNHRRDWKQYPWKNYFPADNNNGKKYAR